MDELNRPQTDQPGATPSPAPRSPQSLMPCDPCCAQLVAALPAIQTPAVYCPHRQTVAMIQQRSLLLQPAGSRAEAVKTVTQILAATAVGRAIAESILQQIAKPSDDEKPH